LSYCYTSLVNLILAYLSFSVEKFNHKTLSDVDVRAQNHLKNSNRFAALENIYDREDIQIVWENIKENIKI
jgi:hypothetical protein